MDRLRKLRKRSFDGNTLLHIVYKDSPVKSVKTEKMERRNPVIIESMLTRNHALQSRDDSKRFKFEEAEKPIMIITQQCEQKSTSMSPITPNFTNLMELEEANEKHLQDAIKFNAKIPVPVDVRIDQAEYNRMYPANYRMPKTLISSTPPDDQDDADDYDIDSEDEEWLGENSARLGLSTDTFETFIMFLENNCGAKTIPTLHELLDFFKHHSEAALEAVYDYWLEKRLQLRGRKLVHQIKIGDAPSSKNAKKTLNDPYHSFRPRSEKMRLRKNRARDSENYMQMLQLKEQLKRYAITYKAIARTERVKHELLKAKTQIFEDQYKKKEFSSVYLDRNRDYDVDYFMNDFPSEEENSQSAELDSSPPLRKSHVVELEHPYPLIHAPGNMYYKIKDNFGHDNEDFLDERQKFHNSTIGRIRRRLGRGGRIIIDRLVDDDAVKVYTSSPEFKTVPISRNTILDRYDGYCEEIADNKIGSSQHNLRSARIGNPTYLDDYELVAEERQMLSGASRIEAIAATL